MVETLRYKKVGQGFSPAKGLFPLERDAHLHRQIGDLCESGIDAVGYASVARRVTEITVRA